MKQHEAKHHEALTVSNCREALDAIPCELFGDEIFDLLYQDLLEEIVKASREEHSSIFLRTLTIFNLGFARGKQAERSRRHKLEMARTFENRPELLELFQQLLQMPAEQRAPVVDWLTQFFKAKS